MEGVTKLDELRGRLAGLSRLLGGAEVAPSCPRQGAASPAAELLGIQPTGHAASPPKTATKRQSISSSSGRVPAPGFQSVIPPSKSVLRSSTNQLPGGAGPAFARLKEEEAKWAAQKGELQLTINKEKKQRVKLEAELKRLQVRGLASDAVLSSSDDPPCLCLSHQGSCASSAAALPIRSRTCTSTVWARSST
jgi:hypothetical protein